MNFFTKERFKKYLKEIVSFVVILTVLANVISYYRSTDLNQEKLFTTNFTLLDNQKFQYDESKPLMIHFWATWCPTCKIEAPNIQTMSEKYQVLTIAVDSGDEKKIKKYLDEKNLNFNVQNDKNRYFASRFNISVYPTTFIYDKNQNLVFSEVGYTSTFGLWLRMFCAGL